MYIASLTFNVFKTLHHIFINFCNVSLLIRCQCVIAIRTHFHFHAIASYNNKHNIASKFVFI